MTRELIEDFREIVLPFLSRTLLKTNYENMGKSDAEEFEKDFNEVLDLAIKALEQEPRWIPVSERLPEDRQYVMVTFGGKIAVCRALDNNGTLQEVTSLILKNAPEIWLYPEPEWDDGYAAWIPLPKPYEPQESKDT